MSDQYSQHPTQSDWQQPAWPAQPMYSRGQQTAQPGNLQPYQYPQQNQPYPQAAYGVPPAYGYAPQVIVHQTPSNGLGVGGFVCGLLGLIFFWVPFFGLVLGLLGLILGGAGISSGRKSGAGIGLAIAGLVLGLVSLIPAAIIIAALSSTT